MVDLTGQDLRVARVVFTDANTEGEVFGMGCATYEATTNALVDMYAYAWAREGLTSTQCELAAIVQGFCRNRLWLNTTPGATLTIYTDCQSLVRVTVDALHLPGWRWTNGLVKMKRAMKAGTVLLGWCRRSSPATEQVDDFSRQRIRSRAAWLKRRAAGEDDAPSS